MQRIPWNESNMETNEKPRREVDGGRENFPGCTRDPETFPAILHLKIGWFPKRKVIFQASIFRGKIAGKVSGSRVYDESGFFIDSLFFVQTRLTHRPPRWSKTTNTRSLGLLLKIIQVQRSFIFKVVGPQKRSL